MNSDEFDQEFDLEGHSGLDRSLRLKKVLIDIFEKNAELLDRLGSDYDENGIPYWEKWHTNE